MIFSCGSIDSYIFISSFSQLTVVSNSDDPVSMTTMKPSSTPGTPLPYGIIPKTTVHGDNNATVYQVHPKQLYTNKPYANLGVPEPGQAGHLQTMTDGLSMGCSTEDDWEEREGFKPATLNPRGSKRTYRGGRGRPGGYDGGRGGNRRRQGGEGFNHGQFGPSHRGRGWWFKLSANERTVEFVSFFALFTYYSFWSHFCSCYRLEVWLMGGANTHRCSVSRSLRQNLPAGRSKKHYQAHY